MEFADNYVQRSEPRTLVGGGTARPEPRTLVGGGTAPSVRITGKCKAWLKGFGFVTRDDTGGDLFVHQTEVQKQGFRSLMVGERVEFEVDFKSEDNKQAINVTGPGGVDVIGMQPDDPQYQEQYNKWKPSSVQQDSNQAFESKKSQDQVLQSPADVMVSFEERRTKFFEYASKFIPYPNFALPATESSNSISQRALLQQSNHKWEFPGFW